MTIIGIILILAGIGFLIAEFHTPGFGVLFAIGIVALIVGFVLLFRGGSIVFEANWWAISIFIILVLGVLTLVVFRVMNTYRRQVTTGKEDLKGKTAVVKEALQPEGTIIYQGELWTAISESGRIEPGEEVIITRADGLRLSVIKKAKE